jgi:hypothetical protein
MPGFCEAVNALFASGGRRRAMSEAAAIADLYFGGGAESIDPGLVERLLWWEGIQREDLRGAEATAGARRRKAAAGARAA